MAFRLALSAETRERIDREHHEALRLYAVPDRWLARDLLQRVRRLRVFPRVWSPLDCVYDAALFWHLIPELAKRLGETALVLNERSDPEVQRLSDQDLRFRVANAWNNTGRYDYPEHSLFFREIANGSPVCYAVDRLVAPAAADPFARHLREIARARDTHTDGRWTPAMLDYPH